MKFMEPEEFTRLSKQMNEYMQKIDKSATELAKPSPSPKMTFQDNARFEFFHANYGVHRGVRQVAEAVGFLVAAAQRLRCAEEVRKVLEAQGFKYNEDVHLRPTAEELAEFVAKMDALIAPMVQATQ